MGLKYYSLLLYYPYYKTLKCLTQLLSISFIFSWEINIVKKLPLMIPLDTKNWVFNRLDDNYQWEEVENSGKHILQNTLKELSPPPDTMTFPNFLTILTQEIYP